MSAKKAIKDPNRVNFWSMSRDVLITAMRNGVVVIVCLFLLFLVIFIKGTSAENYKFLHNVGMSLKNSQYLGWGCFIMCLIYSEKRMKGLRVNHSKEMDRVAEEKKKLQEKLTNLQLSGSSPKSRNN